MRPTELATALVESRPLGRVGTPVVAGLLLASLVALVAATVSDVPTWEDRFGRTKTVRAFAASAACMLGLLLAPAALARLRRARAMPETVFWTGAAVAAAGWTALRFETNREYARATLDALANGDAAAPFQHRVLVPAAVRLARELELPGIGVGDRPWQLVEFVAAVAAVVALRRLFATVIERGTAGALAIGSLVPLGLVLAFPPRVNPYFYPYDTPSVAFLAFGLVALRERRWVPYYAAFAVGCVNRETVCFLAVAFALAWAPAMAPRRLGAHLAAQALLWTLVKLALVGRFPETSAVGGGSRVFVDQWERNVEFLTTWTSAIQSLAVLGGIWVLVLVRWPSVPDALWRRVSLTALPFLAGMAVVGLLAEVRIYADLFPFLAPAALSVLDARNGPRPNGPRGPEPAADAGRARGARAPP